MVTFNWWRPVISCSALGLSATLHAQTVTVGRGDSINIRFVDVDLRAAVQSLSSYMDKPIVFSGALGGKVTLETPHPVTKNDVPRLLRGMLESQNAELVLDTASNIYRLKVKESAPVSSQRPMMGAVAGGGAGPQVPELFVIHLRHAKASDVAATVNALYGKSSALGEVGDRNGNSILSRDLAQLQSKPVNPAPAEAVASVAGRAAAFTGDVTIVPDGRGNSLLVRSTRNDFALIQAAVGELDVRPLQVLIEVLIVEVRHDRSLDFGVEATLRPTSVGNGQATVDGSTSGVTSIGNFLVNALNMGGSHIDATLRAAASRGDVNILSRPILLAGNNERAQINVGSQRPFVQVARVLPTDDAARDQVVQYKDVGTKLQITPTISADGYVMLQVAQEINAATAEQAFNAPVISTRSVETRLLVKDGQTIVLGGLIDHQNEVDQSGVPGLSSIPWIGGLFGYASRTRNDTELFLFLTPRVIRDDDAVEKTTKDFREQAKRAEP